MAIRWKKIFAALFLVLNATVVTADNHPPTIYNQLWSSPVITETFDLTFDVFVDDPDDASLSLSLVLIKPPNPADASLAVSDNGHKGTFSYHAAAGSSANSPYSFGIVASDGINPPVTNVLEIWVIGPLRSPPFPITFEANLSSGNSPVFAGRAIFGIDPTDPPGTLFHPVPFIITLNGNHTNYTTGRLYGGATAWAFTIGNVTQQDGATVFTGQTGMQDFQIEDLQAGHLQFELSDDYQRSPMLPGHVDPYPTVRLESAHTNTVQLSWSSFWDGFMLETCTNIFGSNWGPVNDIPTVAGTSNIVTLTNTSSAQFFRLKH